MNSDFQNAEFVFPELNLSINGLLYITESRNYFVLPENPLGKYVWGTIAIAYVTTNQNYYTCIECFLYKSDNNNYFFTITELYENDHIEDSTIPDCSGLTAEIQFLTNWLLPRMLQFEHVEDEDLFAIVNINKSKTWNFDIQPGLTIEFEAYTTIKLNRQQIKVTEQSILRINPNRVLARNEMFSFFYSFLIFFTLFLRKAPLTTKLSFSKGSNEIKLLGLSKEIEENTFDILLQLGEINDFDVLLLNYFKSRDEYNEIIQLWDSRLKEMRPEIKFLHFTQSLELFHRTFYQNDTRSRNRINTIIQTTFNRSSSSWTQIMRYYHLLEITVRLGILIPFTLQTDVFADRLTKSRNFYTHYSNQTDVWGHFELYSINNLLKMWLRSLILNQLGLQIDVINKAIKREHYQQLNNDILKNKYSMRFGNDFTI